MFIIFYNFFSIFMPKWDNKIYLFIIYILDFYFLDSKGIKFLVSKFITVLTIKSYNKWVRGN